MALRSVQVADMWSLKSRYSASVSIGYRDPTDPPSGALGMHQQVGVDKGIGYVQEQPTSPSE